jgi:hypothetical protein
MGGAGGNRCSSRALSVRPSGSGQLSPASSALVRYRRTVVRGRRHPAPSRLRNRRGPNDSLKGRLSSVSSHSLPGVATSAGMAGPHPRNQGATCVATGGPLGLEQGGHIDWNRRATCVGIRRAAWEGDGVWEAISQATGNPWARPWLDQPGAAICSGGPWSLPPASMLRHTFQPHLQRLAADYPVAALTGTRLNRPGFTGGTFL